MLKSFFLNSFKLAVSSNNAVPRQNLFFPKRSIIIKFQVVNSMLNIPVYERSLILFPEIQGQSCLFSDSISISSTSFFNSPFSHIISPFPLSPHIISPSSLFPHTIFPSSQFYDCIFKHWELTSLFFLKVKLILNICNLQLFIGLSLF